jgi:hypothetical protein
MGFSLGAIIAVEYTGADIKGKEKKKINTNQVNNLFIADSLS